MSHFQTVPKGVFPTSRKRYEFTASKSFNLDGSAGIPFERAGSHRNNEVWAVMVLLSLYSEIRKTIHPRPQESFHARLGEVKNVPPEVSQRQALSNLIRCSRSREPIMTHDSVSLMSRVHVGTCLAGLEGIAANPRSFPPSVVGCGRKTFLSVCVVV